MYGRDYGYAATRLNETIASLMDGTPVYIHAVNADGQVIYTTLKELEGKGAKAICHLDDIDTHPVILGYANTGYGAVYLSRIPVRRYKQGLRLRENCSGGTNVTYTDLDSCIRGDYPKLDDILEGKGKNPFSSKGIKAWHRHWALGPANEVYYRGGMEPAGKWTGKQFLLEAKYNYLAEALEESL